MSEQIRVVRAGERFHTRLDWLDSWHSFSFGEHFDPANRGHGLLLVLNDDVVSPGSGFGMHGHRDMEIVTWVLEGALEHRDSEGNHGVITPGLAQRMSAGTGIRHSEMNASRTAPVRLLQMWVPPDRTGLAPGYEERDLSGALRGGGLITVASSVHDRGVRINQAGAELRVGRLAPGDEVTVPSVAFAHVFVADGQVACDGESLARGDAVRLTDAGGVALRAEAPAEVVVWLTS